MSFASSAALESQPTTLRRGDDPQYADDPDFQDLTKQLSEKLFTLTTNINQLSRQVELLGTRRETERVRERVQTLVEETGNGFKDVGEGLKRVGQWPDLGVCQSRRSARGWILTRELLQPHQKYTQNKLNTDFRASLGEFQLLQQSALKKQREAQNRTALAADPSQSGVASQSARQGHLISTAEQQLQQQEQQHLADQGEVDFQSNLIIEREGEIRNIEQSVGELNELFRDVATMVHDQGYMVDSIADNVENVREDTRGADRELRSANRYQKGARSKACCLLAILAVVLLVVVLAAVYG